MCINEFFLYLIIVLTVFRILPMQGDFQSFTADNKTRVSMSLCVLGLGDG